VIMSHLENPDLVHSSDRIGIKMLKPARRAVSKFICFR
jgi:hypothetical protein